MDDSHQRIDKTVTILKMRLQRVIPTFLGHVCNASHLCYFIYGARLQRVTFTLLTAVPKGYSSAGTGSLDRSAAKNSFRFDTKFFLLLLLYTTACSYTQERGRDDTTETPPVSSSKSTSETVPTFAVYLENSGSMDGYVRGVTALEDDVYQLLVDLGYAADTLALFYINSRPIPYSESTAQFIGKLEPAEFQQRGGNRSNSDLNQIFNELLQQTSEQRATLLISDFILSLGQGNTEDLLNNQRISIYNTFRQQTRGAIAGYLYCEDALGLHRKLLHQRRPPGVPHRRAPSLLPVVYRTRPLPSAALPTLAKVEQLPGFAHSYTLLPVSDEAIFEPFYTVLNNTFKQGSFRTDRSASGRAASGRAASGQDYVHGLEKVQASRRGEQPGTFGFSVAVDLSGVTADASYLTDPNNYQVQGYQLDTVLALDEINMLHPREPLFGRRGGHSRAGFLYQWPFLLRFAGGLAATNSSLGRPDQHHR